MADAAPAPRAKRLRSKRRRRLFILMAVGLACLISLPLAEVGAAIYLGHKDRYALRVFVEGQAGTVEGIEVRKGFQQVWKYPEFEVTVRTNNIGLREDFDYHGEAIDVGFYGDSFGFGHGVEAGERYSDLLRQRLPGKYVVSYSYVNGWAPPHYYVFAKRNPGLLPEIGVVGLFLGNDLSCDITETKVIFEGGEPTKAVPLLREVDPRGYLVSKDLNPTTRLIRSTYFGQMLIRKRHLRKIGIEPKYAFGANAPPPRSFHEGVLDATSVEGLGYLERLQGLFVANKKRLVVFLIPPGFYVGDYGGTDLDPETLQRVRAQSPATEAVAEWLRKHGIECVDPVPRFQALEQEGERLYYEYDGHWTRRGHQAAADVLADYLGVK